MTERKWTSGTWVVGNRHTMSGVYTPDDTLVCNTHSSTRMMKMDDLVKTARRAKGSDLLPKVSFGTMNAEGLILRMADRIEALEAENARLREALSRIVDASDYYGAEFGAEDQGSETLAYAHKSTCNLARAALEGKEKDDE